MKIVILDDNKNNRDSLEELISDCFEAIETVSISSAQDALSYIIKHPVDLVLSDIQMPQIDGFEFLRILKSNSQTKNIPVIFLSAVYSSSNYQKLGYELGVVDYIVKPIDKNIFIAKISNYVKIYKLQNQLKEHNKLIKENVIYSIIDFDGIIIEVSEAFCNISGYSEDQLIGQNHNILRHPDMNTELFKDMWDCLEQKNRWKGEIKNKKRDGSHYWLSSEIFYKYDEYNQCIGYASISNDITRTKEQYIDNLTDLPNKVCLFKELSEKKFEQCMVILISFNNIIKIQNSYGYEVSNSLVATIGKFMKQYYNPAIKKIYTYNYHTYALKYEYSTYKNLHQFLQLLNDTLDQKVFHINLDNEIFDLTVHSFIGTNDPYNINNNTDELQEAEIALDIAIDNKQKIVIYEYTQSLEMKKIRSNITLSKEIKNAIVEDRVILHYQPIYNISKEVIEKYECLVRIDADGVIKDPGSFLQLAKDINQYEKISQIVVKKACSFFSNKPYEFSINISIIDICNENFCDTLFECISNYNVSDKIVLEIVESESIDNYNLFISFIQKAKSLGCKIAIDDFGSGYSNFAYLLKISDHIDYLKIDGSLIKNIQHDSKIQIFVGSLKFLCDNLQINTIAEYVESKIELEYLKSIGIDFIQGYYIGKPSSSIY